MRGDPHTGSAVAAEDDVLDMLRGMVQDGVHGYLGSGFAIPSKGSGADGGKGNALQLMFLSEQQAVAVAVCHFPVQPSLFLGGAFSPHGAKGVDDVPGRQVIAAGDDRFAGEQSTRPITYGCAAFGELGAGLVVDGTAYTAPGAEPAVGGIDDGVDV